MATYIQYHNTDKIGWAPLDDAPFRQTALSVYTRAATARNAVGGTVYLVVGLGRPRRYYLWERFTVGEVREDGGAYCVLGTGWQLTPPQRLEGPAFEAFRRACGWLIGFRAIDRLDYRHTLAELAEQFRRLAVDDAVERFCTELIPLLPNAGDGHYYRGYIRHQLGRAADARFDLAEALRLGTTHSAAARSLVGVPG